MKLLLMVLGLVGLVASDTPCVPRYFSADSPVCVCNATYCDTIDHMTLVPAGQYVMYSTDKAGLRFQRSEGTISSKEKEAKEEKSDASFTLVMDLNVGYQYILGFGTAFTDAAGINLHTLSRDAQKNLLRSYFSPDGIELTLGRVPIAGCDFSTRSYSYDDVVGDVELEHFALQEEDYNEKIPVIREAKAMREDVGDGNTISLIASPWAPPFWMKTNNVSNSGGFLIRGYEEIWAEYYIRFLEEYKKNDVDIWAMTIQNEPMAGFKPEFTWNCMAWTPTGEGEFVRDYLGPAVQANFPDVKLFSMDDQRTSVKYWESQVFGNPTIAPYYQGLALHWYRDYEEDPDVITNFALNNFGVHVLYTEACMLHPPNLGLWNTAVQYGFNILENLNHYVEGWIDWNFALDPEGGPNWAFNYIDSPVIVEASQDEFYKQPSYYALGHFSKFLTPGTKRMDIQSTTETHLHYTAFLTMTNQLIVIVLNFDPEPQEVTLVAGNISFTVSVTADSMNTLVFDYLQTIN